MPRRADVAGALRQTKHLYIYRAEFADAPWRRRGDPMPAHPPPPEVDMRWISAAEWERSPSLLPTDAKLVRERYDQGARCLVMHARDGGELLYHLWLSPSAAWIGWIHARVAPPEGFGLVFDVWAHPDWRRGTLHIPGATESARGLEDLGLRGMVAGVEEHEVVPFARMYARAGLGFITPYEILVWHRLGPLSWHRRTQPGEHLLERCAEIRRRYDRS